MYLASKGIESLVWRAWNQTETNLQKSGVTSRQNECFIGASLWLRVWWEQEDQEAAEEEEQLEQLDDAVLWM